MEVTMNTQASTTSPLDIVALGWGLSVRGLDRRHRL